MSDRLHERRDHVHYALWIGLTMVIFALLVAHQLVSTRTYAALRQLMPQAPVPISSSIIVACGAYLIFRLVRPFSFLKEGATLPGGALYYLGILLVSIATALIASFLAWSAFFPGVLRFYSTAGFLLPLGLVAGFLCVEATASRERKEPGRSPPYLDSGLLSALIIAPGLTVWAILVSQKTHGTRFVQDMYRSDYGFVPLAVVVTTIAFALWWMTTSFRKNRQKSRFYRASITALWSYGVAAIFLYAFLRLSNYLVLDDSPGFRSTVNHFTQTQPLTAFGIVTIVWVISTVILYVSLNDRAET